MTTHTQPTDVADPTAVSAAVVRARAAFDAGTPHSLLLRKKRLRALRTMITTHEREFERALWDDLHKGADEAQLTEIGVIIAEIDHAVRHLHRWAKPGRVRVPIGLWPASARTLPEPLGVVLIIAPWNYPMQLLLAPLVGVLAAGNTAVLKPSEFAPATSALIARLAPIHFPDDCVQVVEGAVEETTSLLAHRFDHIVFTGSGAVGRIVMTAAAQHLTPVTLELGGKSPVWFDDDAHLAHAAHRLAWAKFTNAGQTCVAPDYIMTTPDRVPALVEALHHAIESMWGPNPQLRNDYGRIINDRQFDRLTKLLHGARVAIGGHAVPAERYVEPTIVTIDEDQAALGPQASQSVLKDEIFGPILPIVAVRSPQQAIQLINSWDKPLALYVFTSSADTRRMFEQHTSSGAVVHNAALIHVAASALPFGGIGASGIGAYHGKHSWDRFSHHKPILNKALTPDTLRLIPPRARRYQTLFQRLMRRAWCTDR